MARYFFSHPNILTTNSKLFPGNHQYERLLNISHRINKKSLGKFHSLGVEKVTILSHYVRRGAVTTVASGCTVSLPIEFIF